MNGLGRLEICAVAALLVSVVFVSISEAVVVDTIGILQQTPTGTSGRCAFNSSLSIGMTAPEVRCLQSYLNTAGFIVSTSGLGSVGNETDYFGFKTKLAVASWQAAKGLPSTGYFGPMSRAKYAELLSVVVSPAPAPSPGVSPAPSPVPAPSPTPLTPTIESVLPKEVRSGDVVTVHGTNFTKTGNTIIVRFGVLDQKIDNATSIDGKTLTFTFKAPVMKAVNTAMLAQVPSSVMSDLTSQLEKVGLSIESLNQPYSNVRSEAELDAFLQKQGRSIKDMYDPYIVIVENANGKTVDFEPMFKGLRNLEFR